MFRGVGGVPLQQKPEDGGLGPCRATQLRDGF